MQEKTPAASDQWKMLNTTELCHLLSGLNLWEAVKECMNPAWTKSGQMTI